MYVTINLPVVASFLILLNYSILWLKMISYVEVNHWEREMVRGHYVATNIREFILTVLCGFIGFIQSF